MKTILSGPLALLSVALSTADNPFPAKKLSGEKRFSWTKPIDLELVKEIKTKTGNNKENNDIFLQGVFKWGFLLCATGATPTTHKGYFF